MMYIYIDNAIWVAEIAKFCPNLVEKVNVKSKLSQKFNQKSRNLVEKSKIQSKKSKFSHNLDKIQLKKSKFSQNLVKI